MVQISWLTHSSPQFYKPSEWTDFCRVHKTNRAKVALALEFDVIILAVMSIDLLVQVSLYATITKTSWSNPISVSVGRSWIIQHQEQYH